MSNKDVDLKILLDEWNCDHDKCSHGTKLKLASNVETPIEVFDVLFNDDSEIRKELARNSAVPERILYQLAKDVNCQFEVSDNPSVSSRILDSLARFASSDSGVKLSVLCNNKVSFKTVSFLRNDKDELVRKTACDLYEKCLKSGKQ